MTTEVDVVSTFEEGHVPVTNFFQNERERLLICVIGEKTTPLLSRWLAGFAWPFVSIIIE